MRLVLSTLTAAVMLVAFFMLVMVPGCSDMVEEPTAMCLKLSQILPWA